MRIRYIENMHVYNNVGILRECTIFKIYIFLNLSTYNTFYVSLYSIELKCIFLHVYLMFVLFRDHQPKNRNFEFLKKYYLNLFQN